MISNNSQTKPTKNKNESNCDISVDHVVFELIEHWNREMINN